MNLPKTQKALLQADKMSTSLTKITDHPVPTPNPSSNEHLILVHATAITNGELLWTKNFPLPPHLTSSKVLVPCNDVAGTVILAPPSSPFPLGTEVYARSSYTRTGCARQYSILLTEEMAPKPWNLSWAESAAVPMSAETAWQTLFVHARLEARAGEGAKGKWVFVTGASGGAGVWMVQLAKWAGARVVAMCRKENIEWVKSLGADEVLDRSEVDVRQWSTGKDQKCDLVIDCVGGKALEDAWWVVKDEGTLISIFQPPDQVKPTEASEGIKNLFFVMESNGKQLREVTKLIESGFGRPALDSSYPIDQFQKGLNRLWSGKTKGKVVFELGVDL